MSAVHDFARKDGAAKITLQTEVNNVEVQALYEKLGYSKEMDFCGYNLRLPLKGILK